MSTITINKGLPKAGYYSRKPNSLLVLPANVLLKIHNTPIACKPIAAFALMGETPEH